MGLRQAVRVAAYIRTGSRARKPCTARSPNVVPGSIRGRLRWAGTADKYAPYILFAECQAQCKRPAEELRLENIVGALSLAMVDKMEQAYAAETGRGPSAVAAITQIGVEPGLSIERLQANHRAVAFGGRAAGRPARRRRPGAARSSGGSDKRARALTLTAAGEKLFKSALAARRGITQAALARLSPDERRLLEGIVEKMFPALVGPGDDSDVVCRLCDASVCPMERCPVPQHRPCDFAAGARAWLAAELA